MSLTTSMRRAADRARNAVWLTAALFMIAASLSAQTPTQMSAYNFAYSTGGSLSDMSGATTLINAGVDDSRSSLQTLPFTFNFGGNNYTQYSVSSNGLLAFGSSLVSTTTTASMSTTPVPFITPKASDQITRNSGVVVKVFGSAPNRTMVVQWDTYRYSNSSYYTTYELRLLEGVNEIQFVYGASGSGATNWTGRIGLVAGSSNYLQVNSNTNTSSTTDVSTMTTMPAQGTIYRFFACVQSVSIAGDPSQGAQTTTMANGSTIFANTSVQRGNSAAYTPITITNPTNGCGTRTYSYSITGPNAADYQLSTTGGSLGIGASSTPTITFTPLGSGVRSATLTVTDNGTPQFARTYPLLATGTPRFIVNGNLAQGGTATMASGDTLMQQVILFHGLCADYVPFTLTNTNTNPSAPALTYSMTIDSAGMPSTQYSFVGPAGGTLAPGGGAQATIRYCPAATNVGPQEARLVVTSSDGEVFTYLLRAIAGAPTVRFDIAGAVYTMGDAPLFNNINTCVGEQASSLPVVITNTGVGELLITDFDVYQVDTTDQQGTPALPLVRDAQGRLVPISGYVLSTQPGVAPSTANPLAPLPISLLAGQSRTLYLTYVGSAPGRRFGRAYIRTTAENIAGVDTNYYDGVTTLPTETLGLMTIDLVGRSVGSQLAADASGAILRPLVFPAVRVGDTLDRAFTIGNAGACDLRISRSALALYSGDINEFRLLSVLANARFDAVTGDYILAPGQVDSVVVRFIPSRSGTRMVAVRLRTNDSTIALPGLTERGTKHFDIQGRGKAGLDSRDLVLDPVVIGSSTAGVAVLENSSTAMVEVASVFFEGGEAAEFSEDTALPWPARPMRVLPGAKLELGVRLTPTGVASLRRTQLVLVTTDNDTIRLNIRGEAGTQQLVLSATSLFDGVEIPSGSTIRRMLMISNMGTLPIRLDPPTITGPDAANYRLGLMPRLDLEPGATEYLEVTFAPETQGQSSAQLNIGPAGGQAQVVTLGGIALRMRQPDGDPTKASTNVGGDVDFFDARDRDADTATPDRARGGSTLR